RSQAHRAGARRTQALPLCVAQRTHGRERLRRPQSLLFAQRRSGRGRRGRCAAAICQRAAAVGALLQRSRNAGMATACRVRSTRRSARISEHGPRQAILAMIPGRIYFDHNATTALAPECLEAMNACLRSGPVNPSSKHSLGERAKRMVTDARLAVAESVGALASEIVFTGSGTESNHM